MQVSTGESGYTKHVRRAKQSAKNLSILIAEPFSNLILVSLVRDLTLLLYW